ncbi:sulfite exporter TauE/SafE family protein [Solidesulfovibrio alcoholivorans]|uniref:sulfite exporter TauE/SafE family protein n=1 Tax=Solidesulfovibrio alcoholivorans TaxID=81406 RepID=UPI000498452E|nr:anion permease [Solidesulfovibrio alcoholivorans]
MSPEGVHDFGSILLGLGVGAYGTLIGAGGDIIHVPALVNILSFPVHVATATSHFILASMALAGRSAMSSPACSSTACTVRSASPRARWWARRPARAS